MMTTGSIALLAFIVVDDLQVLWALPGVGPIGDGVLYAAPAVPRLSGLKLRWLHAGRIVITAARLHSARGSGTRIVSHEFDMGPN